MSLRLLVGLGNPGKEYEPTRHNIGFMVLEQLALRHGFSLLTKKFRGVFGRGFVQNSSVVLLKPQTFMNRSGASVQAAASFYDLEPASIVVVHDELDLDLGVLRIKSGGGHGGHNGLRDIITQTGSRDFVRVRVGIGRPSRGDVTSHVLGGFAKSELALRDDMIEVACDALESILSDGVLAAQHVFNSV